MPVLKSLLTVEIEVDLLLGKHWAYELQAKIAFDNTRSDVLVNQKPPTYSVTFNENLYADLRRFFVLLMFLFLSFFFLCLDSLEALKRV